MIIYDFHHSVLHPFTLHIIHMVWSSQMVFDVIFSHMCIHVFPWNNHASVYALCPYVCVWYSCTLCSIHQDMVKERASPVYTKKKFPPVTDSYHSLMVRRVLQDFAATVIQVSDTSLANE